MSIIWGYYAVFSGSKVVQGNISSIVELPCALDARSQDWAAPSFPQLVVTLAQVCPTQSKESKKMPVSVQPGRNTPRWKQSSRQECPTRSAKLRTTILSYPGFIKETKIQGKSRSPPTGIADPAG